MTGATRNTGAVGRERQCRTALAAMTSRRGLVIAGPPGVGKTGLAGAVTARLPPAQYAVAWTTATVAGRQLPAGVLGAVPGDLARRAGGRIPVLVVDDAHHLDDASAAALLALAGTGDVRLMVVVASGVALPDALTALWKDRYLDRLVIGPFDRDGTRQLLHTLLDGQVAEPTVELVHDWTLGSPRLLVEVVRHGRRTRRLARDRDLWWWSPSADGPPALPEVFAAELTTVDPAGRDLLAALGLGEPLPLAAAETVAAGAAEQLEERGLVRVVDENGQLLARWPSPLLGAAVRAQVPAVRRRRVAATLVRAAQAGHLHPDPLLLARWHLAARTPASPALLLRAAHRSLGREPWATAELAGAVFASCRTVPSGLAYADALVHAGDDAAAGQLLTQLRELARDPGDRMTVALAAARHRLCTDRDPAGARAELAAYGRAGAADSAAALDALLLLCSGRPADALSRVEELADRRPPPAVAEQLGAVHAVASFLVGSTSEAPTGAARAGRIDARPPSAPWDELGWALPYLACELTGTVVADPPDPAPPGMRALVDAARHRQAGDLDRAVTRLREALGHHGPALRLLRSEAAASLALCLAQRGRPDDAAQALAADACDGVAMLPGLPAWVAARLAAARDDLPTACARIEEAIHAAHRAGCWTVELTYLIEAAELRGASGPATVADRLEPALRRVAPSGLTMAGAAVLALTRQDGGELLHHARQLHGVGRPRLAWRTAEAALTLLQHRGDPRRAEANVLVGRLRAELGSAPPAAAPPGLTVRETQVAGLAAGGLSNRDIADRLAVSVRTVECHLARAYHKLGVSSRRDLPASLVAA